MDEHPLDIEVEISTEPLEEMADNLEDAAHLYTLFKENLREPALEEWTTKLEVTDLYDRLTDI